MSHDCAKVRYLKTAYLEITQKHNDIKNICLEQQLKPFSSEIHQEKGVVSVHQDKL